MLVQADIRQHWLDYFPAKGCLCALGEHCTCNFFAQCCLSRIWLILLHGKKSCALLSPGTILNMSKPYAMLLDKLQTTLYRKKILCHVVLILLWQYCTRKTLCNILCERLPKTFFRKKSSKMLSEKHVVTFWGLLF